ncbi:syntaxin-1A-like isoform X1 [Dinothrombium tinctorium]|uniref:Syntaxin-1A-like isoform X1 n=1 Tax=Dinothrombium tinctorium TaxID=1965070 RepID=A0A3S3PSF3_9ACAR|nr:syntaxin-1A-like isoform X1 [Dinothrombium tinctorium]
MTKDRLNDLHSFRKRQQQSDVELRNGSSNEENGSLMNRFLNEAEECRELIENLNANIEEIRRKQLAILSMPKGQNMSQLEDSVYRIKRDAFKIKERLKTMGAKTDEFAEKNPSSAETRIRRTQLTMLWELFRDAMSNYNKVQNEYREKCKSYIKRQLEVMGHNASDDTIEDMIESGKESVFTQDLLQDTKEARVTLSDLEARRKDILLVEKSIKELSDMFLEIALLVDEQGETINRIETQVKQTVDSVDRGGDQLVQAETSKRRNRKWKLYCCIFFIILLIILIIVLAFTLR